MQQLRRDPILGRWIIVQYDSEKGPQDYQDHAAGKRGNPKTCPFCPGNELKTTPDIVIDKTPHVGGESGSWNLRVIANKFPALRIEGDLCRQGLGIYDQMNGVGAHEVIIETSSHEKDITDMSIDQIKRIFQAYKRRCVDLRKDKRFQYVLIFKNHGALAGAS